MLGCLTSLLMSRRRQIDGLTRVSNYGWLLVRQRKNDAPTHYGEARWAAEDRVSREDCIHSSQARSVVTRHRPQLLITSPRLHQALVTQDPLSELCSSDQLIARTGRNSTTRQISLH